MCCYLRKHLVLSLGIVFLISCSPKETARVLGFNISGFRHNAKINTQIVDKDVFSTYNKTLAILAEMEAVVYRKSIRKGFIIATNFSRSYSGRCLDSTEVAIFFNEVERRKTKLEVSSLNFALADFVARQLFSRLDQTIASGAS